MSTGQLILTAVQWLTGIWLLARIRGPRNLSVGARSSAPTVSVIIPARNEAASLPHLLASLAAQDRPAAEVLVVDDHSEDATAAVAEAGGATVIAAPPLGGGWAGKPAACAAGAAVVRGDVLAFLDADVVLAPEALAVLVDEHRRRGGLVSVQPYHVTPQAYERLSAVCNLVSMMATMAFTGPPATHPTMAFGPCVVTSRDDYVAVGGHAGPSVRSRVNEDVALARVYRGAGLPVTVLGGRRTVRFRMYPSGLRELVEGWTRSLGGGARGTSPVAAIGPFLWVWGALAASWDGAKALGGGRHWAVDAVVYVAWAAQIAWMLRRIGRFGALTSALFPLPLLAFVALFVRSVAVLTTRRGVRWRGRVVIGR